MSIFKVQYILLVVQNKLEDSDRIMIAKQSTDTFTFLDLARQAAQKQNWQAVTYYLQQLPSLATKASFAATNTKIQDSVVELALAVLDRGDFSEKWQIVKLFSYMGTFAIAPLISTLENDTADAETKWFAARTLGQFEQQQVVVALARLLQNTQDLDLVAIAAKSLAQIGTPAIETLVDLAKKPDYRLVAATSLAHIRLSPVLPALLDLAADDNAEIRLLAIEALGSFHDRRVSPVLIRALQDTHSTIRKEAVIALGCRNDLSQELDLVTHLQPLLYDFNPDVCRQTAIALGKMKTETAINTLNEALKSSNTPLSLKLDAIDALAWSNMSLALDCLQEAIQEHSSLTRKIITVLGRIKPEPLKEQAIAILQDFWSLSQPVDLEFKKALAMALGELQAVTARNILEQLAQDETKMIRLYASASLKKLARI